MFKILSICTHACFRHFLHSLMATSIKLQTVPDFSEVLFQFTDTVLTTFIHCLLHNIPGFIIHLVQVCAVWWPGLMKSSVSCCSSLMVFLAWRGGALSCWKTYVLPATCLIAGSICWESKAHHGNTGHWLSFLGQQRSTWSYPFSTQQWKP